MKRESLFKKNNKGIAMVTIMITIMFLSIIATTLLYISTQNYMMKVANLGGKENFYETEGVLVKTTSALRNSTMKTSDPLTGVNQLRVDPTNESSGYSMVKIAQLVYPAATGSATSAIYTDPSTTDKFEFKTTNNSIQKTTGVISNVTTYTFKDIEIIQTSAQGYKNSVKTDLRLDIYKNVSPGGSAGGVGNMSIMLDSPLVLSTSNFKCLTLTGNCFMANYNGSGTFADGNTYVAPGAGAISMSQECRLNLKGQNNVVYGDINLSGSASVAVYGNLTVYGNINVTGNATLIVAEGGKIYQYTATKLPGRDEIATCNVTNHIYPSASVIDKTSLQQKNFIDFATTINLNDPTGDYGLINRVFTKVSSLGNKRVTDLDVDVTTGTSYSSSLSSFDEGNGGKHGFKLQNGIYGNTNNKFGCGFLGKSLGTTPLNGGYDRLVMISLNSSALKMQESNPYTTWISKSDLTCDQVHCITLSKVGSDEFNYMTAAKGDDESAKYNNTSNPFNNISFKFGTTTYTGKYGDFYEKLCNKYVDNMFGNSIPGGSTGTTTYASALNFENYSRDFSD